MITEYHAKYFAHELSKTGGTGVDRLGRALFDASVDLNPHQIEAALFALRSPLSKGALLADEVGLGKTIEAGLVACQYWAENKRKILIICPASLRKQWQQEVQEKFCLPAKILDARTFKKETKRGVLNPFDANELVITSINFAARNESLILQLKWNLAIIDEAHKLRNSYRESNRMGQAIRRALHGCRKLLLTATPLQNTLLELYGLGSLIDEHLFGEVSSFKTQFTGGNASLDDLKDRLASFCWRKLRADVTSFVKYTKRQLITRPFKPTEEEQRLYQEISTYLKEPDNYALPKGQKHLLILLVRKLLASSPLAVAGTLEKMLERLEKLKEDTKSEMTAFELIMAGEDPDEDLLDELLEDQEDVDLAADETGVYADSDEVKVDEKDEIDLEKVNREIERLRNFIVWARSIGVDTKCKALLKALNIGFEKMSELSAPRKAVIFTESRRTQNFVKKFLDSNGYLGKTVCFNGSNNDSESAEIYQAWLEKNNLNGRSSGSRAIDVRTALIEKFRDDAEILIATEAAAEGVNLQFCALVINYDLPWNPQRIEQRIGRCHRYGQKHDVVVINFLNERNHADRRVLELLEHKFNLFTGVFGASDEILGSIEAGVDFEKRVIEIYQTCRSEEEIGQAFDQLQQELEDQIRKRMIKTRKILLENFDSDVHDRLNVNLEGTREKLDQIGKKFWRLTRHELFNNAVFDEKGLSFELKRAPKPEISTGVYHLISKDTDQKAISGKFLYRMNHLLGEYVLAKGKNHDCQVANLTFKLSDYPGKISVVENLKGKTGWLGLQLLQVDSFANHDYLLFSAFTDDGKTVDSETCQKLFWCDAVVNEVKIDSVVARKLDAEELRYRQATISRNMEENNNYFNEAREQLDKWVHDQELAAQSELDNIKKQIRETTRLSRQATSLDEQYKLQEQIARLEKRKRKMRQKIFDVEDEIAEKRDFLIERLERRMSQKTKHQELFRIRWKVV